MNSLSSSIRTMVSKLLARDTVGGWVLWLGVYPRQWSWGDTSDL